MLGCVIQDLERPWNRCTEMSQPWDGGAGMLCGSVMVVLSDRRTPEVTVAWVCEPVRGLHGVGVMGSGALSWNYS